ncbi:MAG: DUF3667 domain-containing protein [Bacteroidota bacterium]
MENTQCLNCGHSFTGKFCPNCGQRASTQRFTFKRIFSAEFLSDTFNLNQGLLLTLRDLAWRPGYLIRDYLGGKRKRYFNFIALLLILLAVEALLWAYAQNSVADVLKDRLTEQLNAQNPEMAALLGQEDIERALSNQKIIFILTVPLTACFTWLILKRVGYNFAEHCVVIVFLLAMNTFLGISIGVLGLLPISYETFTVIYGPASFIIIGFDLLLFWQLSQAAEYSTFGRIWRVVLAWFVAITVIGLTIQLSIGIFSGMRKSTTERLSPTEIPQYDSLEVTIDTLE